MNDIYTYLRYLDISYPLCLLTMLINLIWKKCKTCGSVQVFSLVIVWDICHLLCYLLHNLSILIKLGCHCYYTVFTDKITHILILTFSFFIVIFRNISWEDALFALCILNPLFKIVFLVICFLYIIMHMMTFHYTHQRGHAHSVFVTLYMY